jgi:chromosome segregation protein
MSLSRLPQYSSQVLTGIAAAVVAAVLAVVLYVQIDRAGGLQADLDGLKRDYDGLNVARERLATEKEAVERDRAGWRERAEKAERESNEVQARLADAARVHQAEQQAHEKTKSGLAALGREVAAAQVKVSEVERDRDGLRDRAQKAERESNEVHAQAADAARELQTEQQAHQKARSELAAAQAKIGEVERERDDLRVRAVKAERESSEAQSRQADVTRLLQAEQQALDKTRGELAAARAVLNSQNEQIRRLEGKAGESAARGAAPER